MAQPRISFWLSREDYDAVKQLMPDDPDLPNTFDEWSDFATKQVAEIEAHGGQVVRVDVNSEDFANYCHASGLERNIHTLRAFAVAKQVRQNNG